MTIHLLAAAPQAPSAFVQLVPLLLILLVFYFILWQPVRKKEKALDEMREALKKGDKVVTHGGFYGEVMKVDSQVVVLKLADNVKVRVAKRAIAGFEGSPEDKKGAQHGT